VPCSQAAEPQNDAAYREDVEVANAQNLYLEVCLFFPYTTVARYLDVGHVAVKVEVRGHDGRNALQHDADNERRPIILCGNTADAEGGFR